MAPNHQNLEILILILNMAPNPKVNSYPRLVFVFIMNHV